MCEREMGAGRCAAGAWKRTSPGPSARLRRLMTGLQAPKEAAVTLTAAANEKHKQQVFSQRECLQSTPQLTSSKNNVRANGWQVYARAPLFVSIKSFMWGTGASKDARDLACGTNNTRE